EKPDRSTTPLSPEVCEAELAVDGMWCASCATAIEAVWLRLAGVRQAQVSFATGAAYVQWDPALTSRTDLEAAVARLGYPVRAAGDGQERGERDLRRLQIRVALSLFLGNSVMMLAIG